MKKVTIETSHPAKIVTSTKWEASDGTLHGDEAECQNAEHLIQNGKIGHSIRRMILDYIPDLFDDTLSRWYYISNEEELAWFKEICGFTHWYFSMRKGENWILGNGYDNKYVNDGAINFIPIGQWVSWTYEDGGDYPGDITVYTLDFFKERLSEFMTNLEEFSKIS
jgi:hypothetical protein